MVWNVSREPFTHSFLSVIHAKRERGNNQLVSRNKAFSTSIDVDSYSSNIPNIPHTNIYDNPISLIGLGTPSQQFQLGNPSQVLGTLEYPYIEQPQTIHPAPANSASLHDWQQSVSLPQISLGPDPHSQARAEPGLLGVSFCENTLFGPPPGAATTSQSREPVDEPEPQVTNLPPR